MKDPEFRLGEGIIVRGVIKGIQIIQDSSNTSYRYEIEPIAKKREVFSSFYLDEDQIEKAVG